MTFQLAPVAVAARGRTLRAEAVVAAAAIGLVGLVVRVVFASAVAFPTPEDTAYYVSVARNLVEGRGLVSDALWSYVTPPLVLPRPAFEVWLPLPTLLIAPVMAALGTSLRAAQIVPIVAGVAVVLLAARLAADVATELELSPGRARSLAVGSGLTAAVALPLILHSALPDSTMLFAALVLGACFLMPRILATALARGSARLEPRLVGLGVLVGLAGLTRNEAAWLGLSWAIVAWLGPARSLSRRDRATLVLVPAIVGGLVFVPWAIRDWLVFGSPLPGQALLNALSVTGEDIFAWQDPPTLSRYLAQGLPSIVAAHVDGFVHDTLNVLLLPSFPTGLLGLAGIARRGLRSQVLRPLLLYSVITFLVTTLFFPVSTTWGTFLHAAGPIHVLLLIGCLLLLDELIAAVGRLRGWTRPVAWLGPALAIATAGVMSLTLAGFAAQSSGIGAHYEALTSSLAAAGVAVASDAPPVITDFPIWYAQAARGPALALPNESPASVVSLARRFGAGWLVMSGSRGRWPAILETGAPDASCFQPVGIPRPADPAAASALGDARLWRIVCP